MRLGEGSGAAGGCLERTAEGITCKYYLQWCIIGSDRNQIPRTGRSWTRKLVKGEALGGKCYKPGETSVAIEIEERANGMC